MKTECTAKQLEFHPLGRRQVVADFTGGKISSDGGALLLREVEKRTGVVERLANCFVDHRDEALIEHSVVELVAQRVMALALGYEDLIDHDQLRHDPLLALAIGKADPSGANRLREADRGKALAGKSTLNRLELTPDNADSKSRYKKIVANPEAIDRLMVDLFLESYAEAPEEIWLDLDATDDPLHGTQEGRFFHGYYGHYCYLPLYIFCGDDLLCARLRPSNIDAAAGTVEELERIVKAIRERWPTTRIIIRADSGFCREAIMAWCESNGVDYLLGLAKNNRLNTLLAAALNLAEARYQATGEAARFFDEFDYATRQSWSRSRRVVGKAEHLSNGANPRFVVTSLSTGYADARTLYERLYCARGEMENRIKEQQLDLFADRTSSHTIWSNQLRLYFSSFAYVLMNALRRLGLAGTEMARAHSGTVRLKLFKVGALIRLSVRRAVITLSESSPFAELFRTVFENLRAFPLRC